MLMMNRETGMAAAPVAMPSPANQLEFLSFGSQWPGSCRREIGSYL
jgi:hypothetical protein